MFLEYGANKEKYEEIRQLMRDALHPYIIWTPRGDIMSTVNNFSWTPQGMYFLIHII